MTAGKMLDMTAGSPGKLFVCFAFPLMLGNVFQQMYLLVDTMIVGKALGVGALAALGAVEWLNWMMLGLIQGMTQGFSIPMAQAFGAKDSAELRRVIGCSAVLSAVCAAAFVLLGQSIAGPLLRILHTPEAIIGFSMGYLRVLFYGLPVVVAYNLFACILRALGDGQTPLNAMIVSSAVNVVLDLLFVLVFRWGIVGAALATVIAQLCSGGYCLYFLLRNPVLHLQKADFSVSRQQAGALLKLGTPMAVQNLIIAVGGMVMQSVVNGFGVAFLAGYTASCKLYGVLEVASTSYGYAMMTYTGQNLGAGRFDRIRSGFQAGSVVAIVTSLGIAAVMVLGGKTALGWFLSGSAEEVEIAMDAGYTYLVIMSACLPALYVLCVCRAGIQGLGNTVLPMISGGVELVIRMSFALCFVRYLGEAGVFWADTGAWIGACAMLLPSWFVTLHRREKGKKPAKI